VIVEHLKQRRLTPGLYSGVWLNEHEDICTFGLWNLSGQLVGFQQYRPLALKKINGRPSEAKYFTLLSKVDGKAKLGVFGLDTLDPLNRIVFLVEGIFDAAPLHQKGANALATLTNNPKHLASWLKSLGYWTVALCEGDNAGKKLATVADEAIFLPEGLDPGDMPDSWFDQLLVALRNTYKAKPEHDMAGFLLSPIK